MPAVHLLGTGGLSPLLFDLAAPRDELVDRGASTLHWVVVLVGLGGRPVVIALWRRRMRTGATGDRVVPVQRGILDDPPPRLLLIAHQRRAQPGLVIRA